MIETNKLIVRRLFEECFNQHNVDVYSQFCSPEFAYHAPSLGELGAEAHRQFLLTLFAAFPDARWTIVGQIAEGDKVVSRWTVVATHGGTFMGIAPTGNRLTLGGICIDQIVGGKIVAEWEEWDTLGFMQQLGAIPGAKVEPTVAA